MGIKRYRSIFISDFHIGAKSCDAESLLSFLRETESKNLFLVGDIFDGWKLQKRWFWRETYSEILDCLLRKIEEGTRIIYIPGNHDEALRKLPLITRQGYAKLISIQIRDRLIHTLADGRKMLVLHGDQFDRRILSGPLSRWSDKLFDHITEILGLSSAPQIVIDGKIKPFSLAKYLKNNGKMALSILNNFEGILRRTIQKNAVDGIICGHTHIPALKNFNGFIYGNPGAWVRGEHHALVEHDDGRLDLIEWPSSQQKEAQSYCLFNGMPPLCTLTPHEKKYRYITDRIIKEIRRIWPEKPAIQSVHPTISELMSERFHTTNALVSRLYQTFSARFSLPFAQNSAFMSSISRTKDL